MLYINPGVKDIDFENLEWNDLLSCHPDKSSTIKVSGNFLKKSKKRNNTKRKNEFINLAFWGALFELYNDQHGTSLSIPEPHVKGQGEFIMEYVKGIDLDRMLRSGEFEMDYMNQIFHQIGSIFRIKENESIVHRDLSLRHIVNGEFVYLIDLENSRYEENPEKVKEEDNNLVRNIKEHFFGESERYIQEGYHSIPQVRLSKEALEVVGSRYQIPVVVNKLRHRYRL